jgi:glycosyltransferase involved in cell wall biosynthesis
VHTPKISVVITAYNRKKFIREAVESVINQTLDIYTYEIIVVKNFKDDLIDSFLSENNVINIFSETPYLGKDKVLGIQASSSEIISFLDDDDLFLPNKLKSVLYAFSENPALVFFRNNPQFFNETGILTQTIQGAGKVHEVMSTKYSDIKRFIAERAAFNSSCISIRKDLVLPHLNTFSNIMNVVDYYLFVLACNSGKQIIQSPEILTQYRVSRELSTSRPLGTFAEFREKSLKLKTRELTDVVFLTGLPQTPAVKKIINMEAVFLALQVEILNKNNDRKKMIKLAIRYVRCMLSIPSKYNPYYFGYAVLSLIDKNIPLKILYNSSLNF